MTENQKPYISLKTSKPYSFAIEWIALNDEPGCLDWVEVSGQISVLLVADLYSVNHERVAVDVVRYRKECEVGK